jgi:predicted secreted Zn-dependent protease
MTTARTIWTFFCCLVLTGTMVAADAPIVIHSLGEAVVTVYRTNYYEVNGTNLAALLRSIDARSPFSPCSDNTDWGVHWDYAFLFKPKECVLRSFDARVDVYFTFPKWVDAERAEESLRREWERSVKASMLHEQGHVKMGVAAAQEMLRRIRPGSWRAANRKDLEARIDRECQKIVDEFYAKSDAYDEQTEHGRTQGTYLRDMNAKSPSRPPNPQGGANGRQPSGSETSRTSAAAASRRSP